MNAYFYKLYSQAGYPRCLAPIWFILKYVIVQPKLSDVFFLCATKAIWGVKLPSENGSVKRWF